MPGRSTYFGAGKKEEIARLELQGEYLSDTLSSALRLMDLKPGLRVLEVGCGSGAVSRKIAALVRPAPLEAIDIDEVFLEQARKLSKPEAPNIDFQVGDVNELEFKSDSFDLVFCRLVLRHQADPLVSLKEMKRVTTKGGRVAVMEADEATLLTYPPDKTDTLVGKAFQWLYGGSHQDTQIGRKLPALFVDAGFHDVEVHPVAICFTHSNFNRLGQVTESVVSLLRMIRRMPGGESVLSDDEMTTAVNGLRRFPHNSRAFFSETYFLAVGQA